LRIKLLSLVTVITHIDTPRMHYVLEFLSGYFAMSFVAAQAPADGLQVVYGEGAARGLRVPDARLLAEKGLHTFDPPVGMHAAGFPVLFPAVDGLGFDLFSGIFHLLSRYEEYGPHIRDAYGRYAHTNSLAHRHGFLRQPLIHRWLGLFSEQLFGEQVRPPFQFQPTYDIDMAWSFRNKGVLRNLCGLMRSMLRGELPGRRISVLRGRAPDPFDCFDRLDRWHTRFRVHPLYFIHCGGNEGPYDKNIPPDHPAMTALVRRLSRSYTVGLHPSWQSGDDPELLLQEWVTLSALCSAPVTASRQHYIRMHLPHTYRRLLEAGITDEYSMGYGTVNGFRASVAVPFFWYDLEQERATTLRIHPFCFMDANSHYEQKYDADAAEKELLEFEQELRRQGGTMITIFHNSFLGTGAEFAGWSGLYGRFLKRVTSGG